MDELDNLDEEMTPLQPPLWILVSCRFAALPLRSLYLAGEKGDTRERK